MDRRDNGLLWLLVGSMLAVMMCAGIACGQNSLEDRFQRALKSEIANLKSASETISPEIVLPSLQAEPEVEILPVPDPLFAEQPVLTYSTVASQEYYVVFFTAQWCGFCKVWKRKHFDDLEAAFPNTVTTIDIDAEPKWNDQIGSLPELWLCRKSDQKPVQKWSGRDLRLSEIIAASEALSTTRCAVANIKHGTAHADTFAAALAWHMAGGQIPEDDSAEIRTFGSLLNIDVDAPDFALEIGQKILIDQKIAWPDYGLSLDWSTKTRTITVAPGRLDIQPGVSAKLSKYRITKSCTLDAITYTPDLRHVTFELTGMLDLTVNLE